MADEAGSGRPPLEVKYLRLFDVLHETRSVTKAAERLGQSQPTVSIWLNHLRRALRDPLFVRTGAGMEPTPRAEALIVTAREALEALHRLSIAEPAFSPATTRRRFRICMTDASHVTLLPQLLAHVRAAAPGARLEVARIDGDTGRALAAGEADLALGLIPELDSGFYQQVLFDQDWVCLLNPRHPRLGRRFTRAGYEAAEHIGVVGGTGAGLLGPALEANQVQRRVVLELPGFLGLPAIIATTDLVATLPRHIGETLGKLGGLTVVDCPVPIPGFTVKQHWHARYHGDAANRWLRGVCLGLFGRHAEARRSAADGDRPGDSAKPWKAPRRR
ncbi:LysR family transcriptional regulator [Falsiroseomonas algicola]|uniref:LysR family transcriptional regulator n=1 Tax=Falsiroseomonas algicola TaxID=2716930 RepID=UPI001A998906|nr:LysR family transcriptional regulator [Falsiroseomonas algicola]